MGLVHACAHSALALALGVNGRYLMRRRSRIVVWVAPLRAEAASSYIGAVSVTVVIVLCRAAHLSYTAVVPSCCPSCMNQSQSAPL